MRIQRNSFVSQISFYVLTRDTYGGYGACCREAEKAIFVSQHHTRCEQWSTLREMLPSRGRAEPQKQPNWGTGRGVAPSLVGTRASRFPVYDSEMTRSVCPVRSV